MTGFYITPESIAEHIGNLFVLGSQLIITGNIKKNTFPQQILFPAEAFFFFDCWMLNENLGCAGKQKFFSAGI